MRAGRAPRRRAWVAALGVLAAMLCGSACTDEPRRSPATPGAVDSSAAGPSSPAPAASGPTYDAVGLDLCARTDLEPLADLSLVVQTKRAKDPSSAPGAACVFEMHTRAGYAATLLVEASTLRSAEEAQRLYRAKQGNTVMSQDGTVDGVGDEAEGFTRQSRPGFRNAEYMIHARSGNLVLKVWLAVGGKTFTPKDVLAGKVLTILRATLPMVPFS
jgi:hypothetical protein